MNFLTEKKLKKDQIFNFDQLKEFLNSYEKFGKFEHTNDFIFKKKLIILNHFGH